MRILTFLAGAALGYVLGARAGREKYEAIRDKASELWDDPRTREQVSRVTSAVEEKAPQVASYVKEKSPQVAEKVREAASKVSKHEHGTA
ncbi:hypothetical protein BJH93_11500 [Kocuria polaris]|nr:hypothetical protein [Kocuria polaris]